VLRPEDQTDNDNGQSDYQAGNNSFNHPHFLMLCRGWRRAPPLPHGALRPCPNPLSR
jgi:hypothetical protein